MYLLNKTGVAGVPGEAFFHSPEGSNLIRFCFAKPVLSEAEGTRVVYAVRIGDEVWVVHAFQKKSTQGIKTPQREIELIEGTDEELEEGCRSLEQFS